MHTEASSLFCKLFKGATRSPTYDLLCDTSLYDRKDNNDYANHRYGLLKCCEYIKVYNDSFYYYSIPNFKFSRLRLGKPQDSRENKTTPRHTV